jgi:hypothetical protein
VRRNLDWILSTPDGRGYTWWEYRDADPTRQIDHGIVPWIIYAEPIILCVHHLLGFRPNPQGITIRPHLLPDMKEVTARLRYGAGWVELAMHNSGPVIKQVRVNGENWSDCDDFEVTLAAPKGDLQVEVWLAAASG